MDTKKQAFAQAVVGAASAVIGMGMYDSIPSAISNDENNLWRSKGARAFKHKKKRRKAADKSRRANRRA